jgi:hypothetical protein
VKRASIPQKSDSQSISPEEFERFLSGLVLKDICGERFQAEVIDREAVSKEFAIEYGERAELVSSSKNEAIALVSYAVRLTPRENETPFAHLQATYRVTYHTAEAMNPACFEQLRRLTLRIHTVPFAREWFRDASARLCLEPILLPLSIAHPAAIPKKMAKPRKQDL